ncbi:hypothetical protein FZZ93_05865 [Halomonas eurihalina]|uniref:Uncharacterized protein n=1 Tax=Halomonas eurihalina TaxID=42566 RepID=A0A5D9DBS7_HALER|nr:hypothetical protein [Halomonas eurihalina]MDR5859390.1 hypothetical protein [Halomonas eurihalina]TZG40570.1 hypothetical protein FZZ93_05865 [Halomonas eurihalina]
MNFEYNFGVINLTIEDAYRPTPNSGCLYLIGKPPEELVDFFPNELFEVYAYKYEDYDKNGDDQECVFISGEKYFDNKEWVGDKDDFFLAIQELVLDTLDEEPIYHKDEVVSRQKLRILADNHISAESYRRMYGHYPTR